MNEGEILAQIRAFGRSGSNERVRVGAGDDCAAIRAPRAGFETVVTTDQVIETKHFTGETHTAEQVGGKVLTRGLSDLAAMGARPAWFLLSLQIPAWALGEWIQHFLSGMFAKSDALRLRKLPLAGGDLAAAERFSAHVVAAGEVPAGKALLRSGAQAGDRVWVTGKLGGSALGLERLQAGGRGGDAVLRHLEPTPRLAEGQELRRRGATAAMDLSDGLSVDLARLAAASGLQARIEAARIPRFEGASLAHALHGGEDYELLFAGPPDLETTGLDATPIGEMCPGSGVWLDDEQRALEPRGFDHFRSEEEV